MSEKHGHPIGFNRWFKWLSIHASDGSGGNSSSLDSNYIALIGGTMFLY
jgi:hypothetical protein